MKVRELIERLSVCDPESEAIVFSDDLASRGVKDVSGSEYEEMPTSVYVEMGETE